MKWFGEGWGAPICDMKDKAMRPDVPCYMCHHEFDEYSQGVIMPFAGPEDLIPCIVHADGRLETACHLDCFKEAVGIQEKPEYSPEELRDPNNGLETPA